MPNADGYVAFYEAKKSFTDMKAPAKHYQGIGAVFGDLVFFTITNHEGTFWSDVRTLASMRPHCQLKPEGARRRQDERPMLASFTAPPIEIEIPDEALSEEEIWDNELAQLLEWYEKNSATYKDSSAQMLAFIMTTQTGILVDTEIATAIRKRYT
jgi:hypothetical protein